MNYRENWKTWKTSFMRKDRPFGYSLIPPSAFMAYDPLAFQKERVGLSLISSIYMSILYKAIKGHYL
jgi:hypothetical protein